VDELAAARAYDRACLALHGAAALTNFPPSHYAAGARGASWGLPRGLLCGAAHGLGACPAGPPLDVCGADARRLLGLAGVPWGALAGAGGGNAAAGRDEEDGPPGPAAARRPSRAAPAGARAADARMSALEGALAGAGAARAPRARLCPAAAVWGHAPSPEARLLRCVQTLPLTNRQRLMPQSMLVRSSFGARRLCCPEQQRVRRSAGVHVGQAGRLQRRPHGRR